MRLTALVALSLALLMTGCAGPERYDAAGDVHTLLVAIRDSDRAAFDAHVDRDALKDQLHARLMSEATRRMNGDPTLAAIGALIGRPLVDGLADALIQPDVFLAVAEYLGYSPDRPLPNRMVIAQALRRLDDDHVCVPRKTDGPCVLIFRDEAGVWRLTRFEGDIGLLRVPRR
jgi:hypothetical protein